MECLMRHLEFEVDPRLLNDAIPAADAGDGIFREVVRSRMAYARDNGFTEYPESVELLRSVE